MDLPVAGKSRYSFPIFVGCLVEMKLKRWAALAAMSMTALCAAAENLTLGVLPAADSIVLDVAVEEGLFAKEGLTVKTVPFKSALEIGAAMRAGRLDGHFGDLMNVFTQNATGVPQTIVVTTTHTSPARRKNSRTTLLKIRKSVRSRFGCRCCLRGKWRRPCCPNLW